MSQYKNSNNLYEGLFFKDCEPTDIIKIDLISNGICKVSIGEQYMKTNKKVAKQIEYDWQHFKESYYWDDLSMHWFEKE